MLDEFGDAAAVVKLVRFGRFHALVGQRYGEALVEERQFTEALRQRVEVELRRVHDGVVGLERDLGTGLRAGFAGSALGGSWERRDGTPAPR